MKFTIFSKALLSLFLVIAIGCTKDSEDQESLDTANSVILVSDVPGAATETQAIISQDGSFVFNYNSRNANSGQTDEDLIRGTQITIPLFDESPVDIRVGRWGTVTFSLVDTIDFGCSEELTEDQVNAIVDAAAASIVELEVSATFNDEPIDIMSNFRLEGISTFIDEEGECNSVLPWRLYLNPRPKGSYSLTFSFTGGDFERTINWVRP